ncbi:MAG: hypothetical protein Q8M92_07085, partial [Candidatus Subteraquimicrobiales bacterium]|nr:hypothetical protein [Candidatus Subteraquimicrobiales bacterium]
IQAGGTLVSTPVAGEPVVDIGADGSSKEFPAGTSDAEINGWLDSTPSAGAGAGAGGGLTQDQAKTAVTDAITEKLGDSTLPSDPTFDSSVPGEQPVEADYKSLLTDFFNAHPLRAITQTAQITTSSEVCSVSGVVGDMTLTFSFCELESLLHLLGIAFVLICTVRSFFIAMGVGE